MSCLPDARLELYVQVVCFLGTLSTVGKVAFGRRSPFLGSEMKQQTSKLNTVENNWSQII